MAEPNSFISPAPIEVAELPWLAELAVKSNEFGMVVPPDMTLGDLETSYLAVYDYLRQAAVDVGQVALHEDIITKSAIIDVRSGLYDPRMSNSYNLGYHYDLNANRNGPGESCLVTTEKAGNAAVGKIGVKPPRPRETPSYLNAAEQQAEAAQDMGSLHNVSEAEIIMLRPNVLYIHILPKLCVHCAPTELVPVRRNLFRFKDNAS